MIRRKKLYWLILPILALTIAGMACGTGFSTSSTIYGLSGDVRAKLKEADGIYNNSLEINEDWNRARFSATVTFSVSEGNCQATLSGEENTSIVLSAQAGGPSEVSGELVTDAFGEIDLETDCQAAKGLDIFIDFTLK